MFDNVFESVNYVHFLLTKKRVKFLPTKLHRYRVLFRGVINFFVTQCAKRDFACAKIYFLALPAEKYIARDDWENAHSTWIATASGTDPRKMSKLRSPNQKSLFWRRKCVRRTIFRNVEARVEGGEPTVSLWDLSGVILHQKWI